MQPRITDSRWAAFEPEQLTEIMISLDHRLNEALTGNMYVRWEIVGELLEELYGRMADTGDSDLEELRENLAELARRDADDAFRDKR